MINEHCKPDAENSVEVHLLTVTLCDVVDELHNEDGPFQPQHLQKDRSSRLFGMAPEGQPPGGCKTYEI